MGIKKIGSAGAGRDYATLQAWEDALPATLTEPEVAEIYNDSEFVSTGTQLYMSGITTSTTNTITIRCAPGHSFKDHPNKLTNRLAYDPSKGVAFRTSSQYSAGFYLEPPNIIVDGLQIKGTGTGNAHGLWCDNTSIVMNCIVQAASGGTTIAARNAASKIINCLAINTGVGSGITMTVAGTAVNCTVVKPSNVGASSHPFAHSYGTGTVKNCAVFNFANVSAGTYNTDGHNVTDQSTVPGSTGNLVSKSYTAQFENPSMASGLEDFRLKAGGDAIGMGITDSLAGGVDIVGTTRASPPSIGAWEYASAGPSFITYSYTGVGGVTVAGDAVKSAGRLFTASGGIDTGGAATVSTGIGAKEQLVLAVGGVVLAGAITINRAIYMTSTASIAIEGQAIITRFVEGAEEVFGTIGDVIFQRLRLLGRFGTINDMINQNQYWRNLVGMVDKGKPINDVKKQVLRESGYDGALNDMEKKYWENL